MTMVEHAITRSFRRITGVFILTAGALVAFFIVLDAGLNHPGCHVGVVNGLGRTICSHPNRGPDQIALGCLVGTALLAAVLIVPTLSFTSHQQSKRQRLPH